MDAAVAGLVGASIGAVAGFGATALGRRADRLAWRRQRRYEALTDFLSASHAYYETLTWVWRQAEDLTIPNGEFDRRIASDQAALYRANVQVQMLRPRRVDKLADELVDAQDALGEAVVKAPHVRARMGTDRKFSELPEWVAMNALGDELSAAARRAVL